LRLTAACLLAFGILACHDFLAPPPARFAPHLPFKLTLASPSLVLGVVLLVASAMPRKAPQPMTVLGISFGILGGLPFILIETLAGKNANLEGLDFISLFALAVLLMPGLAVAAVGGVLAAIQRRSGKTTN
jgi:hypothetical protein